MSFSSFSFFFFFVLLFLFLTPKLNCVGGLSSSCLSLFPSLEQTCFLFPLLPSLLIFVFWPDQSSATHINGQEYWIIWYCKAKVTTYYLNSSSLLVDHAFLTLKTFESIDNSHKLTQFCFFFFFFEKLKMANEMGYLFLVVNTYHYLHIWRTSIIIRALSHNSGSAYKGYLSNWEIQQNTSVPIFKLQNLFLCLDLFLLGFFNEKKGDLNSQVKLDSVILFDDLCEICLFQVWKKHLFLTWSCYNQ